MYPDSLEEFDSLTQRPGLLSRAGMGLANAPTDLVNELMQLNENIGLQKSEGNLTPPYDIPEPQNWKESLVDVGTGLAREAPLFAAGGAIGGGVARTLRAGPAVSSILRSGAAFGLQGETQSNEQGAMEGGLGAGFGAVESMLPGPARYAAAGAVGLATGIKAKSEGASNLQAVSEGGVNALLPLLLGRGAPKSLASSDERLSLTGPQSARELPYVPQMRVIPRENGFAPPEELNGGNGNGRLALPDIEGDFQRLPSHEAPMMLPAPSGMPNGSLIRNPIFTENEALTYAQNKSGIATLQPEVPKPTLPTPPPPPPTKSPRLLLSTVLSHENPTMAQKAAEKLGLTFDGVFGADTPTPKLQFTPKSGGSTIAVPIGTKFKDLKNKLSVGGQKTLDETMAKVVLSPKSEFASKAVAKHLNLEYGGVQKYEGAAPDEVLFHDRTPGQETTYHITEGTTAKELAEKVVAKRAEYAKSSKKNLSAPTEEELNSLEITPANPSATANTSYRPAVRYKGQIFTGADHPDAYTQMENAHPNRVRGENVERGFLSPSGEFQNLMEVARSIREKPVATLQSNLATSPPSPVETPMLPQELKIGDKAIAKIEGESILGTIKPSQEDGLVRFVEKDGTEHDVKTSKLRSVGEQEDIKSISKNVGGASEVESAIQETNPGFIKLKGGGKMRKSNFGEAGSITPETLGLLIRYGAAPLVGGAVGYAEDDQHRWGSAVAGAIAGGLAGVMGKRIFSLLTRRHPSIRAAKTASDRLSELKKAAGADSRDFIKGIFGNETMAKKAASRWGFSSEYDRLARWIQQETTVNLDSTRIQGKAWGMVEDLSEGMRNAIMSLSRIPGIDSYKNELNKYFNGDSSFSAFAASVPKEVADLAALATQSRTQLQNIIIDGLGKGKLASKIQGSIGNYLSTTYKIFHDSKYRPTDAQINAAASAIQKQLGKTFDASLAYVNEYLHEIQASKGMFTGKSGGESLTSIMHRAQDLSPEFKEMLGIYTDPLERMGFTAMKLVNAARSAEMFNEIARGSKTNGLKFAYTEREWNTKIATLQHQSKYGFTPEERATAQNLLDEVKGYVINNSTTSQGRLSGLYMDVRMRDQLAHYDSAKRLFTNPFTRAVMEATNAIKYGQIILSPLQFVRQIYQMPILGMMARTNPKDWLNAYGALNDAAERSRLSRLGILSGDPVGGMLRRDVRAMLDGTIDALLSDQLKTGLHKWEELWRTPDLIVRTSAFLRKEKELLASGMSPNEAAARATDFTNRYTMNYGGVPPIVVKARQLPFINQYLSFSYEMVRITKNLTQDALKGDAYAAGVLATMATVPLVIQNLSEQSLKPEDRAEWNKVKNLGPAYNRHNFRFVQGRDEKGDFRYIDFTPLVLHAPWMISLRAAMSGDLEATNAANPIFGWENTPLLNVATTLVTGRNRHSGNQLYSTADYIDSIRRDVAPLLIGTELDRIKDALTANSEGGIGIVNKRTGQSNTISDILQTYLTSMRPYTLKPAYLKMQATNEARDRIRQQQMTARRIINSNASDQVKQQARDQYNTALDHILRDYQEKLGINEIKPETVAP
jgi:hypothetical protein